MKLNILIMLILKGVFAFAQPSYSVYSHSEFRLGNKRDTLTLKQIKKEKIKFYSYSKSSIRYKKSNHLFSFKSSPPLSFPVYPSEIFIVSKNDTLLIKLPPLFRVIHSNEKLKLISIKRMIYIETAQYNFDTDLLKSFLHYNTSCKLTEDGTCEIFYFELPEMEKLVITKDKFKHLKEMKIVEEE